MRMIALGTRGSALALWQARYVASRLRETHPGLEVRERIIRTEGDSHTKILGAASSRGIFVREIERALRDGEIDLAVHSLKDLPTDQPPGLEIAAIPERHDPRDVLLTEAGHRLDELPRQAVVATGSFRRRCQILHARPDLEVVPVRGNIDTRLRKLREGRFGALVLALAGIHRLGLDDVPGVPIPESLCLPAVGQGALGIETRSDDDGTRAIVAALDHGPSRRAVIAERAFLARLGGGCLAPATAHAVDTGRGLEMKAMVGDPDGERLLLDGEEGPADDPEGLGERLADRLLSAGAGEILRAVREMYGEIG